MYLPLQTLGMSDPLEKTEQREQASLLLAIFNCSKIWQRKFKPKDVMKLDFFAIEFLKA